MLSDKGNMVKSCQFLIYIFIFSDKSCYKSMRHKHKFWIKFQIIEVVNHISIKGYHNVVQVAPNKGRVTHVCVSKLTIICSDNGLSPGRCQAIIWTNAGILLIGPLRTNFSKMLIEIHTFSFKKMHLKMSSGKWRPFCLGLDVLTMHSDIIYLNPLKS